MIKVAIFDVDGVLINGERFSVALAREYGIPLEKTLPFFNGPFQDCIVGKADLKETLLPYLGIWGWAKGVDTLLDYWFEAEHKINNELIEYIQELRKNDTLCFLATDNEKYRFEYILNKMGFSKSFDKVYASANLGERKSSTIFFQRIFNELENINKEEIFFLDDDMDNIKVAKEFGIKAEIYTTVDRLKEIIDAENS